MGNDDVQLRLTPEERQMLDGERGEAARLAMRVIVALARAAGADRLLSISAAHIDGCLYHGPVGLEFAELLAAAGGRVAVPTTLNVSALDLLHPELIRLDPATRDRARRLMDAYVAMGGQATWTCAPYQLPDRPQLGDHVAWAESNAIVFANSVLGARTGRYGDFTDICAAITGRVPYAGLHREENRRAQIVFRLDWLADESTIDDEMYGLIGYVVGEEAGNLVPAIVGLPKSTTEDQLKALAAASASSGSVAMFHAVGVTPEAPTLATALGGLEPRQVVDVSQRRLLRAWQALTTTADDAALDAVSVGTPHFSIRQFDQLQQLLGGRAIDPRVEMYVSTGRGTLAELDAQSRAEQLATAGINVVVDTCTYVTPVLRAGRGSIVMTDSVKWAWYAPPNLGVKVAYGSLADCVESAVQGRIVRSAPASLDA